MTPLTKRLAIGLAVSVALNLFFAGFIAARALHDPHPRHERGPFAGHFVGPRALLRGADPATRQTVRRAMRRHEAAFRSHREELRAARARVSAALAAEPFDTRALEQALEDLRTHTADSHRLLHASIVEVAPALGREQRQRLARHALEHGPGGGSRRH